MNASAPAAASARICSARCDAAGDEQDAVGAAARGAHELERIGLGRAVREQIDARAAERAEPPAVVLDLLRPSRASFVG